MRLRTTDVQMTTAVPLPSKIKEGILGQATRMLGKHRRYFRSSLLHIYVKNANSRIGCTANLFTDDGRYHAYVEDWDVRRAAQEALGALHQQVVKHFERRSELRQFLHV